MSEDVFITGEELNPRRMLVTLASYHGIGPEVEMLLAAKSDASLNTIHSKGLAYLLTKTRTLNGMTIPQVHARSRVAQSQLNFYENGQQKNPGLRTLCALSYGYRIPFTLLLIAAIQDITPRSKIRKRRKDAQ